MCPAETQTNDLLIASSILYRQRHDATCMYVMCQSQHTAMLQSLTPLHHHEPRTQYALLVCFVSDVTTPLHTDITLLLYNTTVSLTDFHRFLDNNHLNNNHLLVVVTVAVTTKATVNITD